MKYTGLLGLCLTVLCVPQISAGQDKLTATAQNYNGSEQAIVIADADEDLNNENPVDDPFINSEDNSSGQEAPNDNTFQDPENNQQDLENNQFDQPEQSNDDFQDMQQN